MNWLNVTKLDYGKISASCFAAHEVSVNPFSAHKSPTKITHLPWKRPCAYSSPSCSPG